jgi:ELWxxDGT repeat protein
VIASTLNTPTADTLKLVGTTTRLAFFFDANAQFIDVLWRTDGTVSGTRSVKNIAVNAENGSSSPSGFTGAAGKVLFSAFPGANNSRQLWTTARAREQRYWPMSHRTIPSTGLGSG